ncbi:papilin-like [Oppia nitens]|uniref:papilin-like n=1 Tax=Oppia nitens TaxID=1686743 RepID=UPI0023DC4E5E|nr:papilin-like [Oppia nitens]
MDISYPDSNRGHLTNYITLYPDDSDIEIIPQKNHKHKAKYNPDRQYGHLSNYKTAKNNMDREVVYPDSNTDCDSAPDVVFCRAIVPRWFCNSSISECQQFNYGGCVGGGNGNNYKTEFMCYSSCSDKCQPSGAAPVYNIEILPPEKNHMDKINYNPDCLLAPKRGWCRSRFRSWFCNSGTATPRYKFHPDSQFCALSSQAPGVAGMAGVVYDPATYRGPYRGDSGGGYIEYQPNANNPNNRRAVL